MNAQCVILARGGSKGIPGKNIINFCGKPLLAWTIEQCKSAENIREVWDTLDKKTEIYQEMKMDAYKTAGQMYEEIGDLENAAKMYSYSYDYCVDKSVELYEKISKV